MNIHIITIAGDIASGKGTVTKLLQKELGYTIYRNGEYFRKLAKEMNMSIVEFQEYLNQHEEIDRQVEKSAAEYSKTHDNLIIDARLGFYAVPQSFKIYLKVDLDEAAKRAYNDSLREDTEKYRLELLHTWDKIKKDLNKNLKEMLETDILATNIYTLGYYSDSYSNLDYTNKIEII